MSFTRPPKGQRLLLHENGLELELVAFYQSFLDETSKVVCEEIRRYFRANPLTRLYRWHGVTRGNGEVETADDSIIGVSIANPDRPKRWPYVVVKDVAGDLQDLWLGQKHGNLVTPNPNYSDAARIQAIRDGVDYEETPELEIGERRGGKFLARVTLEIAAIGSGPRAELNRVTDLVLLGLVVPIQRDLAKRGLAWVPGRGGVGGTQWRPLDDAATRDGETVREVTFELQTEWYFDFYYTAPIVDDFVIQRVYLNTDEPEKLKG